MQELLNAIFWEALWTADEGDEIWDDRKEFVQRMSMWKLNRILKELGLY